MALETHVTPDPDGIHVEVLSHEPDPRRRYGLRLVVWTIEDNRSRVLDVRTLGVLVSAAKARDGGPVSVALLRGIDGPVTAYVRGLEMPHPAVDPVQRLRDRRPLRDLNGGEA